MAVYPMIHGHFTECRVHWLVTAKKGIHAPAGNRSPVVQHSA